MAGELIKSDIKLSIGILVSNRIETIRKCMESLVPLLKSIPCELVALDTVGEETDGSIAIVKEYTNIVYPYTWCADFAHARNTCLSYCSGEWFLFLDDDEWFDSVDNLITFFQSGECEQYNFGTFVIRNYDVTGRYDSSIALRMLRRREDTHFVGKVHEVFHEVLLPGKEFQCFLHHSGYAFADEASKKIHQERNLSILREEVEQKGQTPVLCAQIAQELLFCKDTAQEGYEYCMAILPKLKQEGKVTDSCTQWMMAATVRYFYNLHNYEEVKRQIAEIQSQYQVLQTLAMTMCGILVIVAAEVHDYKMIPQFADQYLELRNWLKENSQDRILQMQLDFPKYYEEDFLIQVVQVAANASNAMQWYDRAYEFWKKLPWEKAGIKCRENLLETLRGMEDKEPLVEYYKHFYREEFFVKGNRSYLPKECRDALRKMEK